MEKLGDGSGGVSLSDGKYMWEAVAGMGNRQGLLRFLSNSEEQFDLLMDMCV